MMFYDFQNPLFGDPMDILNQPEMSQNSILCETKYDFSYKSGLYNLLPLLKLTVSTRLLDIPDYMTTLLSLRVADVLHLFSLSVYCSLSTAFLIKMQCSYYQPENI